MSSLRFFMTFWAMMTGWELLGSSCMLQWLIDSPLPWFSLAVLTFLVGPATAASTFFFIRNIRAAYSNEGLKPRSLLGPP